MEIFYIIALIFHLAALGSALLLFKRWEKPFQLMGFKETLKLYKPLQYRFWLVGLSSFVSVSYISILAGQLALILQGNIPSFHIFTDLCVGLLILLYHLYILNRPLTNKPQARL